MMTRSADQQACEKLVVNRLVKAKYLILNHTLSLWLFTFLALITVVGCDDGDMTQWSTGDKRTLSEIIEDKTSRTVEVVGDEDSDRDEEIDSSDSDTPSGTDRADGVKREEAKAPITGLLISQVLSLGPDGCEPPGKGEPAMSFDVAVDTNLSDLPWHYELRHSEWDLSNVVVTAQILPPLLLNPTGTIGLVLNVPVEQPVRVVHDRKKRVLRLFFDQADLIFDRTGTVTVILQITHGGDAPITHRETFTVDSRDRLVVSGQGNTSSSAETVLGEMTCRSYTDELSSRDRLWKPLSFGAIDDTDASYIAQITGPEGRIVDVSLHVNEQFYQVIDGPGQVTNHHKFGQLSIGRYLYVIQKEDGNYDFVDKDRVARNDPFLNKLADLFFPILRRMIRSQESHDVVPSDSKSVGAFISQPVEKTFLFSLYDQYWNDQCSIYETRSKLAIEEKLNMFVEEHIVLDHDTPSAAACVDTSFSDNSRIDFVSPFSQM